MVLKRTQMLIEIAMASALAIVLDIVPFLSFKLWAQGGSISFAMIPIFLIAFRWGWKAGLLNGLVFALLQLIIEPMVVHPVQGLIDYGLAFPAIGLAGLFANSLKNAAARGNRAGIWSSMIAGVLLGSLLRFLCHFTAGIVFFGAYAPKGQPVALYSLLYNGSYMLPAAILSIILLGALFSSAPILARTRSHV
ncbi:energy-coupled thiamine transporter ThiT [Ectobacillus sp. JY-23]|uniref:energy-coupled thiamine transporter ThiT n=1 Tax=Ectobacillus sp. JY-23 TaxID=2933872 RepID=UPI001FF5BC25|nr:energy-coupled thiamine transporter ThiT [Ectobacillus sp. JY-23]UOY91685.1 energy-coupled thiamine transporter ThiT [Ectobacillus sp. JY-23]